MPHHFGILFVVFWSVAIYFAYHNDDEDDYNGDEIERYLSCELVIAV